MAWLRLLFRFRAIRCRACLLVTSLHNAYVCWGFSYWRASDLWLRRPRGVFIVPSTKAAADEVLSQALCFALLRDFGCKDGSAFGTPDLMCPPHPNNPFLNGESYEISISVEVESFHDTILVESNCAGRESQGIGRFTQPRAGGKGQHNITLARSQCLRMWCYVTGTHGEILAPVTCTAICQKTSG
jgi:hypothetical protein